MEPLTPEDILILFPDTDPLPESSITLAALWLQGELARRAVTLAGLTAEQLSAVRMAVAAKALALKAGVDGPLRLQGQVTGGVPKQIEALEIPDEIKVKYRAGISTADLLVMTARSWDDLAASLLALVFPASLAWSFPGAAR